MYLLLVEHAAGVDVHRVLVLDGLVVPRLGHLRRVVEEPGRYCLSQSVKKSEHARWGWGYPFVTSWSTRGGGGAFGQLGAT